MGKQRSGDGVRPSGRTRDMTSPWDSSSGALPTSAAPQPKPKKGKNPKTPKRSRMEKRADWLFLAPLPFAIRSIWQPPVDMAVHLGAFGLLILAAWLTREGVRAQSAYDARAIARRPAFPRKLLGSLLTGLGLAVGSYSLGGGVLNPAVLGVVGLLLHGFAFGPDPLKDKGMEGVSPFQGDRVARAVEEAETHLETMRRSIDGMKDQDLADRVAGFQQHVRRLIATVEADPRRLTAARRYLGVYLLGARDAAEKFAALAARRADPEARASFEALLDDLEANFAARTEALLSDDRQALDIEIEVLRDRLQREGLRADPAPAHMEGSRDV